MPLFIDQQNRVWSLNQDAIDLNGDLWAWDGQPIDPAAGPDLHSVAHPLQHMPLLGLAKHCGLRQPPAAGPDTHLLDPLDTTLMRLAPHAAPAVVAGAERAAERQVA